MAWHGILHHPIPSTRAPLLGRLTPPATLAQGRIQLNAKEAERIGPCFAATSDLIKSRAACAELIALGGWVPLLCACWRCRVPIGSTDVVLRFFLHEPDREDNQMKKANRRVHAYIFFFFLLFFFPHTLTFQLLDKPWQQVSSLLPPGSCLQFLSRTGFSNPTARRFLIECC